MTVPVSGIPTVPARRVRTVASGRAPGHATGRKPKALEKVFAAEIERRELPSLRAIKARAKVGTDKARTIREQLSEILQEARPEAA